VTRAWKRDLQAAESIRVCFFTIVQRGATNARESRASIRDDARVFSCKMKLI
jgi:hypothetical protein